LRFAGVCGENHAIGVEARESMQPAEAGVVASAHQCAGEIKNVGRIVGLSRERKRKQDACCENEPPHGTGFSTRQPPKERPALSLFDSIVTVDLLARILHRNIVIFVRRRNFAWKNRH
jgi:hypothetical protein